MLDEGGSDADGDEGDDDWLEADGQDDVGRGVTRGGQLSVCRR